jgi:hypothetical protein
MGTLEIRIKRQRTPAKTSTLEALEKWASLEGRSAANAVEYLLENRQAANRFHIFLVELRNPGRETT